MVEKNKSSEESINLVSIIGNVGQDPIVKTLSTGTSLITFSVATSENRKNADPAKPAITEWHAIRVYNNELLPLVNNIKRGSKVYVEGSMRYLSYLDNNGNKVYSFYIDATYVALCLLKKKPLELGNIMKLEGTIHNIGTEVKENKDGDEDRSYTLLKCKLRTHREFTLPDGTLKNYSDDHNIRCIMNPSAWSDLKSVLEEEASVMVLGKIRYVSHVDEKPDDASKIIRKNVIVDVQEICERLFVAGSAETAKKPYSKQPEEAGHFADDLPF